jgi:hypothetical protein
MTIQQFLRSAGTYYDAAKEWAIVLVDFTIEAYGEHEVYLINSDGDTIKEYTGQEPVVVLLNDILETAYRTGTNAGKADLQQALRELLGI